MSSVIDFLSVLDYHNCVIHIIINYYDFHSFFIIQWWDCVTFLTFSFSMLSCFFCVIFRTIFQYFRNMMLEYFYIHRSYYRFLSSAFCCLALCASFPLVVSSDLSYQFLDDLLIVLVPIFEMHLLHLSLFTWECFKNWWIFVTTLSNCHGFMKVFSWKMYKMLVSAAFFLALVYIIIFCYRLSRYYRFKY